MHNFTCECFTGHFPLCVSACEAMGCCSFAFCYRYFLHAGQNPEFYLIVHYTVITNIFLSKITYSRNSSIAVELAQYQTLNKSLTSKESYFWMYTALQDASKYRYVCFYSVYHAGLVLKDKQNSIYYCKVSVKSSLRCYFSCFSALNLLSWKRISSRL